MQQTQFELANRMRELIGHVLEEGPEHISCVGMELAHIVQQWDNMARTGGGQENANPTLLLLQVDMRMQQLMQMEMRVQQLIAANVPSAEQVRETARDEVRQVLQRAVTTL